MKHRSYSVLLVFFTITYPLNSPVLAKSENEISVLDRLEKKLLEQEATTFRFDTPNFDSKKAAPKSPQDRFEMPATNITAPLPEEIGFDKIEKNLKAIEIQTDELAGRIETLKADFISKAANDNLVEIAIEITNPEKIALRNVNLMLNDFEIFETQDREGQWIPDPRIIVFSGPLAPGNHTLLFKGKTVRRIASNVPLDQNTYHEYNQIFKIEVPKTPSRTGFRIKLSPPEQENINAKANLETYGIK